MNTKYVTDDIAIDTETIEELASNKLQGIAKRTLYKALSADRSSKELPWSEDSERSFKSDGGA
jgi:hypothetical protein